MAGPGEDLPTDTTIPSAAAPAEAAAPIPDTIPPAGGDPTAATTEPAAVIAAPDATPVAGSDAPPADASEPTLLEKFDAEKKAAAEKPAEGDPAKPAEEAKPAEAAPAEPEKKPDETAKPEEGEQPPVEAAPVELPKVDYFEKLTLPETIQMDDARRGEFSGALDLLRTDPAAGAQAIVDLHNKAMTEYADHLQREQYRVFNETRRGWQNDVMADPVLGGAGFQTAMGKIAQTRDVLVSSHKPGTDGYQSDVAKMEEFLRVTGAGDHPWFLGMMHRAHRFVGEPGLPPANPKPPPSNGINPGDRRARLYDRSTPNQ
jgi:hypothetical protein